ncbi:MAG: hypothetical protein KDD03_07260, partial [Gelidibacter sp.]|nr:hypothetical protein [Gelidibacter sp.]
MKTILLVLSLLVSSLMFSQDDENQKLGDDYFKNGEFEKALITYQKLYDQNTNNSKFLFQLIKTHQQLEHYPIVENLLLEKLQRNNNPTYLIELGYNYQLMDSTALADKYYNEAIAKIDENPSYAYMIAMQFETRSLLDNAIATYKKASALKPDLNFNIQLARIYGELGDIENMFSNYLDYIEIKPEFINNSKRAFSEFVSENKDNENNLILKKLLLKKIQVQPDEYWYDLLSWLFNQEKEYDKAFTQEKALYRRNPESLNRIVELAVTTLDDKQYETALEIFNYILENSQDPDSILLANQFILDIETTLATEKNYPEIDKKYKAIFTKYGTYEQTTALQLAYGNFVAFYLKQPEEASNFLKETLKLNLSAFQEATIKLKLGDILVFQEKFNEALIYYTQIQANLKNSTISQEARFKVAKTSYYKGDFDWAESQLKILKSSTSQLIANDALDLKLLISD